MLSTASPGPRRDATALNAAAALVVAGRAADLGEGLELARDGDCAPERHIGDVVGAARRGEGSGMSYLEGIGAWTRERLEERRETRSLAAALLAHRRRSR